MDSRFRGNDVEGHGHDVDEPYFVLIRAAPCAIRGFRVPRFLAAATLRRGLGGEVLVSGSWFRVSSFSICVHRRVSAMYIVKGNVVDFFFLFFFL